MPCSRPGRALRQRGDDLVLANSGAGVEAAWRRRPPDPVLLDVNLPAVFGITVTLSDPDREGRDGDQDDGLRVTPTTSHRRSSA
ncbi:MAG: hypothetical protein ACFCVK_09615 [Acidimicrobiales bacterium]